MLFSGISSPVSATSLEFYNSEILVQRVCASLQPLKLEIIKSYKPRLEFSIFAKNFSFILQQAKNMSLVNLPTNFQYESNYLQINLY